MKRYISCADRSRAAEYRALADEIKSLHIKGLRVEPKLQYVRCRYSYKIKPAEYARLRAMPESDEVSSDRMMRTHITEFVDEHIDEVVNTIRDNIDGVDIEVIRYEYNEWAFWDDFYDPEKPTSPVNFILRIRLTDGPNTVHVTFPLEEWT